MHTGLHVASKFFDAVAANAADERAQGLVESFDVSYMGEDPRPGR